MQRRMLLTPTARACNQMITYAKARCLVLDFRVPTVGRKHAEKPGAVIPHTDFLFRYDSFVNHDVKSFKLALSIFACAV